MGRIGLVGFAAALAACSTVPEGNAQFTREVDVEYTRFAACAFQKLEETWPNEIRLVDLRGDNAVRVSFDVTTYGPLGVLTVRQLEAYVRKLTDKRSRVDIRTRAGSWPEQMWSKIESCGRSG